MNRTKFYQVRDVIENISSGLCSDANAPASHLPENVVDWITQAFIDDYLDSGEDRLPEVNDVLKGMCDYLQEECSADADELREKKRKIDEIKNSVKILGYSLDGFSDSDLVEIYDETYNLLENSDEYNNEYNNSLDDAVKSIVKKKIDKNFDN